MSFITHFQQLGWDDSRLSIYGKTARDVERALSSPKRTLDDFKALISPA
ncbi:2-iminoacetate synthase ThiH, partial [Vibrio cholerae]|nr:2-iminoacetate synthase ThiH [Vibrio cholerae]